MSATWTYNGKDTVYASYAKYNPAASSLPRAASWDRNLTGTFIDASFDQNGVLFAAIPRGSSSGKLFVPDMTPHTVNEFLVGTSQQLGHQPVRRGSTAAIGRARHFWEDTNNNARVAFNPPPGDSPGAVHPEPRRAARPDRQRIDLRDRRPRWLLQQVLRGTLETEWHSDKTFIRGSFT